MAFLAQKLISASGATEETDPDFNLVTQLYQFDGSNGAQNNTFTGVGASGASQSWTRNGSTTQGSFSPFSAERGKWAVEFTEDNTDYLALNNSDFAFGTGDFTAECFVFFTGNATTSGGIFHANFTTSVSKPALALRDTTGLTIYSSSGQKITGNNGTVQLGVWYHLALVRASGVIRVYKDGSLVTWDDGTTTATDTTDVTSSNFLIGKYYDDNYTLDGYISNFRVTKSAVYTGAFTKPTTPLTDITNTVLLACRDNRFMDASSEGNVFRSINGYPKIKPFSPFAPSEEYDASTMGGSGHFVRTTNDTLSISDSSFAIGTSDFTIEGWFYFDGANSGGVGLFQQADGLNGPALGWWPASGGGQDGWQFYYGSGSWTHATGATARMYEWTHIAFVRSSNVSNLYVNGVKATNNVSDSTNYTSTVFEIGQFYSASYEMQGYISNFKMCLNAIYTSAFTPPTALVTPTSGGSSAASTKILVDFTNAAMFDQTGKTNISTIGNTQLNTSIKKFGTASAKFDETGDYLTILDAPYFRGCDFTIEGFVYFNSSPTDGQGLFVYDSQVMGNRAGYGPALGTYANAPYQGKWHSYYGTQASAGTGTQGNSEATPSATTWIHFAYVRTSGVIKIFIDGSQIGSDVAWTGDYKANDVLVIGGYYSTSYLLNGYIDSYRVTLKARYTSNFTAPTKAFPNL